LLAVLLLALSPWHIYWSQNARFYTALMLFYGLAQLCIFIWLESENPWYLILSMVIIAFAMLERGVTLFIFPVLAVYFIALHVLPIEKPPGLRWRNIALFLLPMLFFGILVVFSSGNIYSFFTKIVGHQHNPIRVFLAVIYDAGLPLFLLALLGGIYSIFQKSRLGLFLLIGALVPLLILVIIAPFTQAFSRYVFQTLINWIVLGAMAIKAMIDNASGKGKFLALGFALLLIADSFSQDVLYYSFQNGNREDFKGAFEIIAQEKDTGDLIISGWPEIGSYYLDETIINAFDVKIDEVVTGDKRVWFVVDNRSGFPPSLQEWIETNSNLVGVRDVYIPGKLMMMRVYLYQPGEP
jgi:4-amino-4-deoxy-L-arabinose transferase-like glycosyltransferase